MMWGEVGRLYYWTPEHALQAHDWDDVADPAMLLMF